MTTFAYVYPTFIEIIVTDGSDINSFSYPFGKDQDVEISITESLLLAQHEMNLRNPTPVAI